MKLGLDLHGVIDTNYPLFSELTQALISTGNEVHILTGASITPELIDNLIQNHIKWTNIYSVTDLYLGTDVVTFDEKGEPHMDTYLWDKSKAEYCREHSIDLHIDDSDIYGMFFKTPYARYFSKSTERVRKMEL